MRRKHFEILSPVTLRYVYSPQEADKWTWQKKKNRKQHPSKRTDRYTDRKTNNDLYFTCIDHASCACT